MRNRDTVAVSALHSAIAALDNAGALAAEVAPGPLSEHVAGARVGLGAGEAPRRELTQDDEDAILAREIAERRAADDDDDDETARHGVTDHAERLRAEAKVLERYTGPA